MKKVHQIICVMLVVILALAVFPTSAFAFDGYTTNDGVVQYGDFHSLTYGRIIFYPEDFNGKEKLPVLTWANGTACAPALYKGLFEAVAKQGFIIVASSDVMSADGTDQVSAIDYIIEKNADPNSPLYQHVDTEKIGAFGHSQGGRSTVNAAKLDSRILACVSIAGSNTKDERKNITCPTFYLSGTNDLIVASSMWVTPTYKASSGPAVYASLNGGVHTSCILSPDAYAKYISLWFHAWLNDDTEALDAFKKGGALFNDSAWKNVQSKNMSASLIGSVFSDYGVVLILGAAALVAMAAFVVIKKKKEQPAEA